ncbi:MAG: HDIG domain-containing protein [Anaerolineales bacterium]|nr:HDIG domain-containing protein [Anaerolineales bacterium]
MSRDLSPYIGRWVALADGQVSGVGYTGPEALRAARHNRPKDKNLELRYIEPAGGEPLTLSPILEKLYPILAKLDRPVYLVGGAVRDALLGRASHDLDFAVPEKGIKTAFKVADALGVPAYILDKERDIGRVMLADEDTSLDFARYRGQSLEDDLRDRDFTINALALPAVAKSSASVIDLFGGLDDLQNKIVRQVHEDSLTDDPIRGLRAVRIAVRFGFTLDGTTAGNIEPAVKQLSNTSAERARDEWFNIMNDRPHIALRYLHQLGGLRIVLPRIALLDGVEQSAPHHEDVFEHTLSVLRWLPIVEQVVWGETAEEIDPLTADLEQLLQPYRPLLQEHLARRVSGDIDGRLVLRIAALYHDVGKAETQTVEPDGRIRFLGHDKVGATIVEARLRQFRLSNEAIQHIKQIVRGHMRPLLFAREPQLTGRAIFRFCRKYSTAVLDILLLSLADHLATYDGAGEFDDSWGQLLELEQQILSFYSERFVVLEQAAPLLSGRDVMDHLQLEGGPEIGRLLRLLAEAQTLGEVTTREEAFVFIEQTQS